MSDVIRFENDQPAQALVARTATPGDLLRIAMERGDSDLDRMERLMVMQQKWEENEARKAYFEALAGFRGENVEILKDKNVKFKSKSGGTDTDYWHATLGNVVGTVSPALAKHGLSHSWTIERKEQRIHVTCRLAHALGHSETVSLDGPLDDSGNKNSIQQAGSSCTYLQRYTLMSILGLSAVDDDDDGGGADNNQPSEPEFDLTSWGEAIAAAVDATGLRAIKTDFIARKDVPERALKNFQALYNKRLRELKGAAS